MFSERKNISTKRHGPFLKDLLEDAEEDGVELKVVVRIPFFWNPGCTQGKLSRDLR